MSKFDDITKANDVPVTSNVALDMHPSMVIEQGRVLATDDSPIGQACYENAVKAQATLYRGMELIQSAHTTTYEQHAEKLVVDGKRIVGDISDERKATLAADLGQAFDSIARKFDSHLNVVRETVDTLTATVEKSLKPVKVDVATAQQASDLRKIVAAQPDKMGWLMGCLQEGDYEPVHAVLATSPRASGLTKDQWDLLKNELVPESACPKEFGKLKAARLALSALTRSSQTFVNRYSKLLPKVAATPAAKARDALKAGV